MVSYSPSHRPRPAAACSTTTYDTLFGCPHTFGHIVYFSWLHVIGRWCHQPAHLQPKKVCQRKEPADSCAVMTRGGESQQIYSVNRSRSVRVWDSGAKSSSRYFPLQEGCSPHSCPARLRRALHGLTVWPAHPGMHGRTPSNEYSYSLSVTCSVFKSFPPLKKASYVTVGAMQPEFLIVPKQMLRFTVTLPSLYTSWSKGITSFCYRATQIQTFLLFSFINCRLSHLFVLFLLIFCCWISQLFHTSNC